MRVYIAAPFARAAEARRVMVLLQAAGHEIARDWTVAALEHATCAAAPMDVRKENAAANLLAVLEADAFLLLTFEPRASYDSYDMIEEAVSSIGRGCHSELGIALCAHAANESERDYRVLVCGPDRDANAFALLAERYETEHDAVFALGLADREPAPRTPMTTAEFAAMVEMPPGQVICLSCGVLHFGETPHLCRFGAA